MSQADSQLGVSDGATATIPVVTDPSPVPDGLPEFKTIIPPDYAEKGWVQEVKDIPSMFKMLDDAKTAMGRRPAGIPQDSASEAEWHEFDKARGVPEKSESYDFSLEGKESTDTDKQFHDALRPVLHKAGITPKQLEVLLPGFEAATKRLVQGAGADQEKQDTDFEQESDKVFGDQKDRIMTLGNTMLSEHSSESLKSKIGSLSNDALIIIADLMNNVSKKFIASDQLPDASSSSSSFSTPEDQRAEGQRLMATKAYADPFHRDHKEVTAAVRKLYGTE